MSLIQAWNSLPQNKRHQLSSLYKIKDYGTTEAQLEFELSTKLPVGMLGETPKVTPETTPEIAEEVVEEVKEVKPKKAKKAKKSK